jgi:hypothetical protein
MSARPASADEDKKPGPDYGLGVNARQILLTKGVMKIGWEDAPGGTRQNGASVEFARRGDKLEFVFGFGYDSLEASDGFYLEKAGDPLTPGKVDYLEFRNLEWYTADVKLIGYLQLHKILSLRYGAGLGIGYIRGQLLRTDAVCTGPDLQKDCAFDPNGTDKQKPDKLPPVFPVVNVLAGLQFRPVKALAVNLDIGLRTVPYVGASATLYLW